MATIQEEPLEEESAEQLAQEKIDEIIDPPEEEEKAKVDKFFKPREKVPKLTQLKYMCKFFWPTLRSKVALGFTCSLMLLSQGMYIWRPLFLWSMVDKLTKSYYSLLQTGQIATASGGFFKAWAGANAAATSVGAFTLTNMA